jgi:hypothetical protein
MSRTQPALDENREVGDRATPHETQHQRQRHPFTSTLFDRPTRYRMKATIRHSAPIALCADETQEEESPTLAIGALLA